MAVVTRLGLLCGPWIL